MSADGPATTTPSDSRRWYLVGAIALVAVTIAAAVAITWIATQDGARTEASLETAAAAARLRVALADALTGEPGQIEVAEIDACPAGPAVEVLGDVAEALGGGQLQQFVEQGEIGIRALGFDGDSEAFVQCSAEDQEGAPGSVNLIATAAPRALLDQLQAVESGEPFDELGTSRGGQYVGACQRSDGDCGVFWYDDQLLVGIGGTGPAFADIDAERVKAALGELLPALVDGLAES